MIVYTNIIIQRPKDARMINPVKILIRLKITTDLLNHGTRQSYQILFSDL